MSEGIKSAAVIGSGVMGSAIAAQFAGAGIRTHLLDVVPRELPPGSETDARARNRLAEEAVALVARTKLFQLAESLGGVESLIEVPARMTHASTATHSAFSSRSPMRRGRSSVSFWVIQGVNYAIAEMIGDKSVYREVAAQGCRCLWVRRLAA